MEKNLTTGSVFKKCCIILIAVSALVFSSNALWHG